MINLKIAELEPEKNFDVVKARIISKQGPRRVEARGQTLFVWDILLIDDSDSTVLTLWGTQAGDKYNVGDVVTIENGWCKMFQDKKQISLGRNGKIFPAEDDPSIPRSIPE